MELLTWLVLCCRIAALSAWTGHTTTPQRALSVLPIILRNKEKVGRDVEFRGLQRSAQLFRICSLEAEEGWYDAYGHRQHYAWRRSSAFWRTTPSKKWSTHLSEMGSHQNQKVGKSAFCKRSKRRLKEIVHAGCCFSDWLNIQFGDDW